eukprot:TRINITY_DN68375_c0_g1_i1.p1 TRINITY_DN68375_c0_g1~~TRINITY_DN68375_c0_g1_i1.p1  ORF type:complete len:337 (-),score=36.04 TRINITY_DN68375_c0_g1_i1:75-1085(-)
MRSRFVGACAVTWFVVGLAVTWFVVALRPQEVWSNFEFHLRAGSSAKCPEPLLACITSVLGEKQAARCGIDIPIFVVSLPGSPKRAALSEAMRRVCPNVVLHFVDALDMIAVARRFSHINANKPHDSELAVTLSHLLAARAALEELRSLPRPYDNCRKMALVVEDDVDLAAMPLWEPASIRAWCAQAKLPNEWEVVQMGLNTQRHNHRHLPEVLRSTPSLFSPRTHDHFGAYALLYSEHGLGNLLQRVTCSNGEELCIDGLPQISDILIFEILKSAWISNPPYFLHPVYLTRDHGQNWRMLAEVRENAVDVMMSRWCPEEFKHKRKQPCLAGHLML